MGLGLVDPILPSLAKDLHASPSQVELLFSSYILSMGIAMLVTSTVSSWLGPKRTLLGGRRGVFAARLDPSESDSRAFL